MTTTIDLKSCAMTPLQQGHPHPALCESLGAVSKQEGTTLYLTASNDLQNTATRPTGDDSITVGLVDIDTEKEVQQ